MSTDYQDHNHSTTAIDTDIAKLKLDLAAQDARIRALEGATPPPPPAPPTGRPWADAVTTQTVSIPASIDTTGTTDVTLALRAFFRTVQSGTRVLGPGTGKTYKISGSILMGSAPAAADSPIKGKSNIIFDGQGTIINNVAGSASSTASNERSTWYWSWLDKPFPTHLVFRNWVNKGANPQPGKLVGSEFAAFAHLQGGQFIEVTGISSAGTWGDFVTLNSDVQQVWAHHNTVADVGRNNVSVVAGSHVLIEDNQFGKAGYCTFDIEPEGSQTWGITDVIYRRNTSGLWLNCYFALDGANSGKPISDIVVDDNISTAPLLTIAGFSGSGYKTRPQRVSFQRNAGPAGGALRFAHIDGLKVTGNPLPAPTLTDCT